MKAPDSPVEGNRESRWHRRWRCAGLLALLSPACLPSYAVYNANMSSVVTEVLTYPEATYIFFTVANQPTSHPACNPTLFVVPSTTDSESRKMIYARLLTAYVTGRETNIGYDAVGDCAHGYIRVHRVG